MFLKIFLLLNPLTRFSVAFLNWLSGGSRAWFFIPLYSVRLTNQVGCCILALTWRELELQNVDLQQSRELRF